MQNQPGSAVLSKLQQSLKREAGACAARRFRSQTSVVPTSSALTMLLGMLVNPADLESPLFIQRLILRLQMALRRERVKARSGHSGYDFSRHLALHQTLAYYATSA